MLEALKVTRQCLLRLVTNIVKKLLKKYNQIWKKVKDLLNIKSDSKPVYRDNDKYIKAKIKIFNDNANTNFQGKGVPEEKAASFFTLIMLDSVVKAKRKYYPQTHLEECKYESKKIKMEKLINDDLEKAHLMSLIMILVMKRNLKMRKIMMKLMNNLSIVRRSILITIKV